MSDVTTLGDSHTVMTELLLPNDTNQLGRALGGAVLHWMDVCAAVAAMRFSNRQCVTAAIDGVTFDGAIELGEVAVVEAYVFDAGSSSMAVNVDVVAEDTAADQRRDAASAVFTYVALNESGTPTTVPELVCQTDEEQALRQAAIERRREQLEAALARLSE
ncbi:MAG: acyl-CoA thioesterase [Haloferacaceae archaeon]